MNEFVEQFLIESRELVEQATDDLLTLEGKPGDKERLDGAFRAFHTLKGAAGIVDFDAMGRALHAAEEVLSARAPAPSRSPPTLIGDCLTCLDQVVQWLDAMAGAAARSADRRRCRRPTRWSPASTRAGHRRSPRTPVHGADWRGALVGRHADVEAVIAVRYAPAPDAYLRGEDPLALLSALPELLALEIEDRRRRGRRSRTSIPSPAGWSSWRSQGAGPTRRGRPFAGLPARSSSRRLRQTARRTPRSGPPAAAGSPRGAAPAAGAVRSRRPVGPDVVGRPGASP